MKSAVLLVDLQRDFLAGAGARMPVSEQDTEAILRCANQILAGQSLQGSLPIVVVNEFARDAIFLNILRRHAAIAGSHGADLDPRLADAGRARKFSKSRASAFSNPELDRYLQREGIRHLYVLGVMAEGCVRATVLDARKRGYLVTVIADAVASDAKWKLRLGLWSMKRAGAEIAHSPGPQAHENGAGREHGEAASARTATLH
jgi:nicotinamidase-related amidase